MASFAIQTEDKGGKIRLEIQIQDFTCEHHRRQI
jgi:hypothetical protein